ncbi:hypothetical protein M0R45_009932 [Rubus argutus]|uniref:Cytochrome P450 n=1 Tax=Rubus argutus TaxID=59490 RepID=A0AAW1Y5Y1_RUBAR
MLTLLGLCLVAFLIIYITHWIMKWRNPKCNGVLPPGSMGFPLIGETLSLIIPSYSLDIHPFIKKRLQRYGPIFRTSLVGRPVVISADPDFNNFLFQQEGRSVELWYLDTFSKIFVHEGDSKTNAVGIIHKYLRSIFLNHLGVERLKEKLLPEIEGIVNKNLCSWSSQESVEVKHASSVMVLNFSAKQMISYDAEKSDDDLSESYTRVLDGLMSFPLSIPGTAYYNCIKHQNQVTKMLRDMLEDLLAENRSFLEELTAEHEAILKNRENPNSSLTWNEYKSMTFTLQVINETLRLANLHQAYCVEL